MAQPTVSDVQAVDPVLTNLLIGYMQADERFVASRVFPEISVDKDSGTYYIVTKKYFFLDEMGERAPGAPYASADYGVATDTYTTLQQALNHPIADETRANSQLPMDLEQIGTKLLAQRQLIRKERKFSAEFMVTGVWETDDDNATTDWDDYASGDPVADVLTASDTISDSTGLEANSMVLGKIVNKALRNHPDIIDRIKHVQGATLAAIDQALAAVFGVDNYWVAKASYNSANEAAAFSGSAIIGDDCLVCHVDPTAGIFGATAGKTFTWAPGGGGGIADSYRDESRDADIIKTKSQWDQKATATDLGYFFADVV